MQWVVSTLHAVRGMDASVKNRCGQSCVSRVLPLWTLPHPASHRSRNTSAIRIIPLLHSTSPSMLDPPIPLSDLLPLARQNVVPVVATSLEGSLPRIRTAIVAGTAIPLVMFLLWDAAILGALPASLSGDADRAVDPLVALQAMGSSSVGVRHSLTHSLTRSFNHSLPHSLTDSLAHSLTQLKFSVEDVTHSLICSLECEFTNSVCQSASYSGSIDQSRVQSPFGRHRLCTL